MYSVHRAKALLTYAIVALSHTRYDAQARKQTKTSLRQLLLEEVDYFEAADRHFQDEVRADQQMGRGVMPPPQSPR